MERLITGAMIDQFCDLLRNEEKSEATISKYRHDLTVFMDFLQNKSVTKELVISYKKYLVEHYAPSSVNSMLASVNRYFKQYGWYECVTKSIKIQNQSFRDHERVLTKEEYLRLLCTAKVMENKRLFLLMETICATGIRVSELRFITVGAAQRGQTLVSLKGKTRQVLLPAALCCQLCDYASQNGIEKGSIFVTHSGKPIDRSNILHSMKAIADRAGVARSKVYPHNLRHLFACVYYQESKDLSRLADILGHSNINTTRIYTSISMVEHCQQLERLGLII